MPAVDPKFAPTIEALASAADDCPDSVLLPKFTAGPGLLSRGGVVRQVLEGVLGTVGIGPITIGLLFKIAAVAIADFAAGKTISEIIKDVVAAILAGTL